jgi:hypothetical protein
MDGWRNMKPVLIALAVAASLATAQTARAWLGDTEDALTQHFGRPKAVEAATGDIPMQKGYYAELKENFSTNVSLIASTQKAYAEPGYGLDLVETRTRYKFEKDDLGIVVYLGNADEKYGGVDFAGKSAREVINCRIEWQKNKNGDKVGHSVAFAPAAVNAILDDNKGNSAWPDEWQSISVPGTYIKRTADKTRLAIAYGPSANAIYRLEVRMVDDASKATD